MSDGYGIQPTGYVRKPLPILLAEIEAAMITEFGPGIIQTAASPLGQLNALMADLISEIDERNLDIYQSYDPDQAEGTRLEVLSRLRLIRRNGQGDDDLRKSITNEGQARVDIQDLSRAIKSLDGVSYSQVFVNETGEVTNYGLERGSVSVAVIGGDDEQIAKEMRNYIVPGINTYGNSTIVANIEGFCRSVNIIRPIPIDVFLTVNLKLKEDKFGCPPPSSDSIKRTLENGWQSSRINGQDISFFEIRSILERNFSNVEVLSISSQREEDVYSNNLTMPIAFIEMANVSYERIVVNSS